MIKTIMSRRKQSHPKSWKELTPDKSKLEPKPDSPNELEAPSSSCPDHASSPGFDATLRSSDAADSDITCAGHSIGPIAAELVMKETSEIDKKSIHQFEIGAPSGRIYFIHPKPSEIFQIFGPKIRFVAAEKESEADILIYMSDEEGLFFKVVRGVTNKEEYKLFYPLHQEVRKCGEVKERQVEPAAESRTPSPDSTLDTKTVVYRCYSCSVSFRNRNNLAAHQEYYCRGKVEEADSYMEKVRTNNSYVDSGYFEELRVHRGVINSSPHAKKEKKIVHVCQLCRSSFIARHNCESHMLILHCSKHVPMCKFCNFVGKSWLVLREHVFSHVKVEEKNEESDLPEDLHVNSSYEDVECRHDDVPSVTNNDNSSTSAPSSPGLQRGTSLNLCSKSPTRLLLPTRVKSNTSESATSCNGSTQKWRSEELEECKKEREKPSSPDTKVTSIRVHHEASNRESTCLQKRSAENRSELKRRTPENNKEPASPLSDDPVSLQTTCVDCSIHFRSKSTFDAHKQFYCKGRHSSRSERHFQRESSPRTPAAHSTPGHHSELPSRNSIGFEDRVPSLEEVPTHEFTPAVSIPTSKAMVYLSPAAPSAMLVGAAPVIAANGTHYLSPVYILAPPVPMRFSLPHTLSSPPHQRCSSPKETTSVNQTSNLHPTKDSQFTTNIKSKDHPLDLRVKTPPSVKIDTDECSRYSPQTLKRSSSSSKSFEVNSNGVPFVKMQKVSHDQSGEQSSGDQNFHSPLFHCTECDISFRKAKTLMAHKQFYCSDRKRRPDKEACDADSVATETAVTLKSPQNDGERGRGTSCDTSRNTSPVLSAPPIISPPLRKSVSPETKAKDGAATIPNDFMVASMIPPTQLLFSRNSQIVSSKSIQYAPSHQTVISPVMMTPKERMTIRDKLTNQTDVHMKRGNDVNQTYHPRPHLCRFCGISFGKADSLEVHQRFYCQKQGSLDSQEQTGLSRGAHLIATNDVSMEGESSSAAEVSSRRLKDMKAPSSNGITLYPHFVGRKSHSNHEIKNYSTDSCVASSSDPRKVYIKKEEGEESSSSCLEHNSLREVSSAIACGGDSQSRTYAHVRNGQNGIKPSALHSGKLELKYTSIIEKDKFERVVIKQEKLDEMGNEGVDQMEGIEEQGKGLVTTNGQYVHQRTNTKYLVTASNSQEADGAVVKIAKHTSFGDEEERYEDTTKMKESSKSFTKGTSSSTKNDLWSPTHFNNSVKTKAAASSLLGVKTCKYCNIHFRSLSTFIAHKKYYCSSSSHSAKSSMSH